MAIYQWKYLQYYKFTILRHIYQAPIQFYVIEPNFYLPPVP